jgi:hypothetical protein
VSTDPTCTHGGFTIRCVVGAFACEGCGARFVPESLLQSVGGEEHRAKKGLRETLTQLDEARAQVAALREALDRFARGEALGGAGNRFWAAETLRNTAQAAETHDRETWNGAIEAAAKAADHWADAYPLDVFPNLEIDYSAELTKTLVSRISGSMGRHVASGIAKDIRALRRGPK